MARGLMATIGTAAVTAAVVLTIVEAKTPGAAAPAVQATADGATPVIRLTGILGGETLAATAPIAEGGRQAVSGFGINLDPMATTEPTLPAQPTPGG